MALSRRLATAVALGVLASTVSAVPAVSAATPAATGAARAGEVVTQAERGSWRVDGRVRASVVLGGTVYLGGSFSHVTGPDGRRLARRNLAAFSLADGTAIPSWQADTSAVVRALETDGTSLWVGGYFGTIGGVARRGVARLDAASGSVLPDFDARLAGGVESLDLDGGALYIGGRFSKVGDLRRRGVAKLSAATGTVVRRFRARLTTPVFALRADPSSTRLYVGGPFSVIEGLDREGLAVLDDRTGRLRSPRLQGSRRPTLTIDVSHDGRHVYAGDGGNWVTAWRASTGKPTWARYALGNIQVVRLVRGRVYFGFHEGIRGHPRARVLAAEPRTGRIVRWYPRFRGYWGVFAIGASSRYLVVGGQFARVAGARAGGWARFSAS